MVFDARGKNNDKRTQANHDRYGKLAHKKLDELQKMASDRGIKNTHMLQKGDLLEWLT